MSEEDIRKPDLRCDMFRSVFLKGDFGCSVEDKLQERKSRNKARQGNCVIIQAKRWWWPERNQ